jgi:hypothetical protein
MLVQFITEPTIGVKERRLIRSHVMRGKNAGKPRPARTQLIHQSLQPVTTTTRNCSEEFLHADYKHTLSLNRLLWNELSLTSYPYRLTAETEKFVYQRMPPIDFTAFILLTRSHAGLWVIAKVLYPSEFCAEVDLSQYVWFQYALEDQACKITFPIYSYSYSSGLTFTRLTLPPSHSIIILGSFRRTSSHFPSRHQAHFPSLPHDQPASIGR